MGIVAKLKRQEASCKRILKELRAHEHEVISEDAKLSSMKGEGANLGALKHQEDLLAEWRFMVKCSYDRLISALDYLSTTLAEANEQLDLEDNPLVVASARNTADVVFAIVSWLRRDL
ncbi:unnamed protein product [Linum trigynum]|uniref:Tubulin-specific chaperone A n=1 Tax=Linum trigynum TaxID=586398 RepID=A0AAV2FSX8_9ROSI